MTKMGQVSGLCNLVEYGNSESQLPTKVEVRKTLTVVFVEYCLNKTLLLPLPNFIVQCDIVSIVCIDLERPH